MTVGRIPWSRVMQFGAHHGLREPLLSHLWTIINAMDDGYREYMKNEHDRHARYARKKKPAAPSRAPLRRARR